MSQQMKKVGLWIAGIVGFILLIYLAFFAISVTPTIILSPFIVFEIIKEGGWSELSLWHKLLIICGSSIFVGIIIKEFWPLVGWIKEKIK